MQRDLLGSLSTIACNHGNLIDDLLFPYLDSLCHGITALYYAESTF